MLRPFLVAPRLMPERDAFLLSRADDSLNQVCVQERKTSNRASNIDELTPNISNCLVALIEIGSPNLYTTSKTSKGGKLKGGKLKGILKQKLK